MRQKCNKHLLAFNKNIQLQKFAFIFTLLQTNYTLSSTFDFFFFWRAEIRMKSRKIIQISLRNVSSKKFLERMNGLAKKHKIIIIKLREMRTNNLPSVHLCVRACMWATFIYYELRLIHKDFIYVYIYIRHSLHTTIIRIILRNNNVTQKEEEHGNYVVMTNSEQQNNHAYAVSFANSAKQRTSWLRCVSWW